MTATGLATTTMKVAQIAGPGGEFQVVVRDNHANAGGINTATATVVVDGASGPFAITAPNTGVSWAGNSAQTVTWNVANTTAAPVSAANVRILFSSDGGNTFPTVLAASTANDGSESITVPNGLTTTGRRFRRARRDDCLRHLRNL